MSLINALRTADARTENGMVTNSSSHSACLDLFFIIGAVRPLMKDESGRNRLINKFEAAHAEDALITRKMLFWARDVRGGAGEREAFRVLLRHACKTYPNEVIENIHLISEFGRWDDVFETFGTPVEKAAIELIIKNLKEGNSLLAKWLPRLGGKVHPSKRRISNKVRNAMGLSASEFRKLIVSKTNVVETLMCSKNYANINYSHIPSLAMTRYSKAFYKNDLEGFKAFKESLVKGEVTVNAGAIYPYDITKSLRNGDTTIANEQWKALPDYMKGNTERVLPVCDTSGSMSTLVSGTTSAMDVSISLGLYISERNEGPFKNAFITFSERPELQYLHGDLRSRFSQMSSSNWGYSTNLQAVFELVLDKAVKSRVPASEMPTVILIISDMEFDQATQRGSTALEMIRSKYESAGYEMPNIVFWNVASRHDNVPAQIKDERTALVSGFSPSILKSVLSGKNISPISIMLDTVNSERYSVVQ